MFEAMDVIDITFGVVLAGLIIALLIWNAMNSIRAAKLKRMVATIESMLEKRGKEIDTIREKRYEWPEPPVPEQEKPQRVQAGKTSDMPAGGEIVYSPAPEKPSPKEKKPLNADAVDITEIQPPADEIAIMIETEPETVEVIEEAPAAKPAARPEPVRVTVYSAKKKDADFSLIRTGVRQALSTRAPGIAIDFSNVLFMYDDEIAELKKLLDDVKAQGIAVNITGLSEDLNGLFTEAGITV